MLTARTTRFRHSSALTDHKHRGRFNFIGEIMKFKSSHLALAIAAAVTNLAYAEAETELDQIQVYGQKQVKNLQDTTASVGLVTADDLEKSTIQDINDVFARVANVSNVNGGNESIFAIRGVSIYGLSDDPVDYTASVYVDDVPLNIDSIRWGSMGLWDVEQVEVYRGPQGTLQGRNSLMGAIHLKTVDPTFDYTGKAQASTGAFNTHRLSAAGGGGIANSDFAIRVSADKYQSDGYIENETRNDEDYAGFDRSTYRAKLLYKPKAFSNLDAMLTLARHDNKIGDQPFATTEDPFDRKAVSNVDTKNDTVSDAANLKINLGLGNGMTVTSVTGVNDVEYDRLDDWDSSATDFGYIAQANKGKTVSQELRLTFGNDTISGVTGVYYSKKEDERTWDLEGTILKSMQQETAEQALAAQGFTAEQIAGVWAAVPEYVQLKDVYAGNYETTNYAVFADADIKATQDLTISLGARYDKEDQDRDNQNVRTIPTQANTGTAVDTYANALLQGLATSGSGAEEVSTNYDAFLPKAGVTYAITEDVKTGFTVQQGYRSGGSSVSLLSQESVDFDPEFTTNYELSLRSQFANGGITANANVFYTDWTDQQVDYSPSGDSRDTVIANAGESNLWGAELEVSAHVTSTVEVFGNAGYVETEFEKFTVQSGGELIDYKGNEFPDAPKYTASVGSVYRGFNGVFVSLDANFRDEAYTDVENTESLKVDARTLVNTKVGYEARDWAAFLWVTNLTDREYLANTRQALLVTEDARVTGAPRMIGATFTSEF